MHVRSSTTPAFQGWGVFFPRPQLMRQLPKISHVIEANGGAVLNIPLSKHVGDRIRHASPAYSIATPTPMSRFNPRGDNLTQLTASGAVLEPEFMSGLKSMFEQLAGMKKRIGAKSAQQATAMLDQFPDSGAVLDPNLTLSFIQRLMQFGEMQSKIGKQRTRELREMLRTLAVNANRTSDNQLMQQVKLIQNTVSPNNFFWTTQNLFIQRGPNLTFPYLQKPSRAGQVEHRLREIWRERARNSESPFDPRDFIGPKDVEAVKNQVLGVTHRPTVQITMFGEPKPDFVQWLQGKEKSPFFGTNGGILKRMNIPELAGQTQYVLGGAGNRFDQELLKVVWNMEIGFTPKGYSDF